MTLDPFVAGEMLMAPGSGVLVAPIDPARMRMNIGIRTLSSGADFTITVHDRSGAQTISKEVSYPATWFIQVPAETLLGAPLPADATVTITMNSGGAIIYGSITDNTTQDPSLQFARPMR
jgi:hypothetical protein